MASIDDMFNRTFQFETAEMIPHASLKVDPPMGLHEKLDLFCDQLNRIESAIARLEREVDQIGRHL